MPRFKNGPKMSVRCHNIWLKNWDQTPQTQSIPLMVYMKKLLIYFPKDPKVLKHFALTAFQRPSTKGTPAFLSYYKKICRQVVSKYKREYFKALDYETSYRGPSVDRLHGPLKSLKVYRDWGKTIQSHLCPRKIVIFSKHLKIADFSGDPLTPVCLMLYVKYNNDLESLSIRNMPFVTAQESKRLIKKQSSKLKHFAITGRLAEEYTRNTEAFVKQWQWFCSLFSNLQTFKFDAETPDEFDVNCIPFYEFKKKNINYDIRVTHSVDYLVFSEENAASLADLDFLGINLKKEWLTLSSSWDKVKEEHSAAQKKAKNLLFLNLCEMREDIDFTNLFQACRNIQTLDLILSELNPVSINFSGLQELHNLSHMFLQLHNFDNFHEGLFSSLKLCVDRHQKLSTLNLGLFGGFLLGDYLHILPLFESLANVLSKLILQFSLVAGSVEGIRYIYDGIQQLEALNELTVLVTGLSFQKHDFQSMLDYHSKRIGDAVEGKQNLEYVCFASPHIELKDLNIDFGRIPSLSRITLGMRVADCDLSVIHNIAEMAPDLKSLELGLMGQNEEGWIQILKAIRGMQNLEVLRLREVRNLDYQRSELLRHKLDKFLKKHPKLELIFGGKDDEVQVLLCTKEYYMKHANPIFWMHPSNLYELRPARLHIS